MLTYTYNNKEKISREILKCDTNICDTVILKEIIASDGNSRHCDVICKSKCSNCNINLLNTDTIKQCDFKSALQMYSVQWNVQTKKFSCCSTMWLPSLCAVSSLFWFYPLVPILDHTSHVFCAVQSALIPPNHCYTACVSLGMLCSPAICVEILQKQETSHTLPHD